ncbi:Hypothetical predicted protein, partial [Olea europaea subsp. europaea]
MKFIGKQFSSQTFPRYSQSNSAIWSSVHFAQNFFCLEISVNLKQLKIGKLRFELFYQEMSHLNKMLGDKSQPTRYELLSMVSKHSRLLGKTVTDEDDVSDVEMDSQFWHDIIDLYFGHGRESRGRQDDDLVFFVSKK